MKSEMNSRVRNRDDGKKTRAKIIACAGPIFARDGYYKATSKSICQAAKVNMAAVNYHFGNYDGLYLAVMKEIHQHLMSMDLLNELAKSSLSTHDKIAKFIDQLISTAFSSKGWYFQVWVRELLNPSPLIGEILNANAIPKANIIIQLFSDYLGYDKDDVRLYASMVSVIAPITASAVVQYNPILKYSPVYFPQEIYLTQIRNNAILVLDSLKKK